MVEYFKMLCCNDKFSQKCTGMSVTFRCEFKPRHISADSENFDQFLGISYKPIQTLILRLIITCEYNRLGLRQT